MNLPNRRSVCSNCPFSKKNRQIILSEERVKEIAKQSNFVCHKTLGKGDAKLRQCAGSMLLNKDKNDFYLLAKRLV